MAFIRVLLLLNTLLLGTTFMPSHAQIVLEYQPNRPFYSPNPGIFLPQLIPPGKPWPANPSEYESFSQTSRRPPLLEDRFKEEKPENQGVNRPQSQVSNRPQSQESTRPQNQGSNRPQDQNFNVPQSQGSNIPQNQGSSRPQQTISLEYKPRPPSYYPRPTTIAQLIPSGQPWPEIENRYPSFSQTTESIQRPQSIDDRFNDEQRPVPAEIGPFRPNQPLGGSPTIPVTNKPKPPSFHPVPVTIPQLIPPGKPWPASEEGYQNFTQTLKPISVEDRFKEESTTKKNEQFHPNQPLDEAPTRPITNKPKPPSFHPVPVTIPQLVPTGQPWPAKEEDYQNFSQTTSTPNRPDSVDDRFKEEASTQAPTVATSRPNQQPGQLPSISVTNKPKPPSFHPVPVTIPQLVPSGQPWPANEEGYQNFSQTEGTPVNQKPQSIEDRFKEESTTHRPTNLNENVPFRPNQPFDESPTISVTNKPKPPSFHPVPVTIPQLVPSGWPWPANAEGYENFSQTTSSPIAQRPQLIEDRFKDETTERQQTTRRTTPARPFRPNQPFENSETIPITNKPKPPSFHPVPVTIPQLIPSGEPWPANPEGYPSFSQTTIPPRKRRPIPVESRFKEYQNDKNEHKDNIPKETALNYETTSRSSSTDETSTFPSLLHKQDKDNHEFPTKYETTTKKEEVSWYTSPPKKPTQAPSDGVYTSNPLPQHAIKRGDKIADDKKYSTNNKESAYQEQTKEPSVPIESIPETSSASIANLLPDDFRSSEESYYVENSIKPDNSDEGVVKPEFVISSRSFISMAPQQRVDIIKINRHGVKRISYISNAGLIHDRSFEEQFPQTF